MPVKKGEARLNGGGREELQQENARPTAEQRLLDHGNTEAKGKRHHLQHLT